jgi:hypothetical protein
MLNRIQNYVMKPEEVPECWLGLRPEDIVSHAIDELLSEEIDEEEMLN